MWIKVNNYWLFCNTSSIKNHLRLFVLILIGVAAYPNVSLSEYEKGLRENERLQKPVGLPDEL